MLTSQMYYSMYVCFILFQALLCNAKRPLVRNVRSDREFRALIKHHKTNTGLPVIVDFFSHGCGPCRMIAPHMKRLAKKYRETAVFAKVDVNVNRETSARQHIRSMPTFQFYLNGKKRHQFSGGDVHGLQRWTKKLANEASKANIRVTVESLKEFYQKHDSENERSDEKLLGILDKYGGLDGGPMHAKLCKMLKKKYGAVPVTEKAKRSSSNKKNKKNKKNKRKQNIEKPNLHLASIDALKAELEKRHDSMAFDPNGGEEADDEVDDDSFNSEWKKHRVTILGGGPAGLSAALYAARAGLRPVVVAPPMGGQLQGKGVTVENYPGVIGGTGPSLVALMAQQAQDAGAFFNPELITKVDFSTQPMTLHTNTTSFRSHSVIIATGADSRWLGVPGEYEYRGGGVSSCATCDGFLFRDKVVVVVGGGDTAMEDALVLARTSASVLIIHRRDEFRASKVLANRVLKHEKIKVLWDSNVVQFKGEDQEVLSDPTDKKSEKIMIKTLTHVLVKNKNTMEDELIPCAAAFVAIGHDPNTKIFQHQGLTLNDGGYISVKEGSTHTDVAGVFAAGDVADHVYRQAVTSAGTGAMAALDAERWLSEQGIQDEVEEVKTNEKTNLHSEL